MSGSKGILEGLSKNSNMDKNKNSQEEKNLLIEVEECSVKRSYSLKPSTIKKLQELKVFIYDDPNITYNEIVDEAICKLYEAIKSDSK